MEAAFYKSPLLRYYKAYTIKNQNPKELIVRMHSNKLFLLFLHPDHPAMSKDITEVSFKFNTNALSGKNKKGATNLQPTSNLLQIVAEGQTFVVKAGIFGKLIETNDVLCVKPNNLHLAEGFIAILMPPLNKVNTILNDYLELIV